MEWLQLLVYLSINIVIPQQMSQLLVLILFVRVFLLLLLLHWEHTDICIMLQPQI